MRLVVGGAGDDLDTALAVRDEVLAPDVGDYGSDEFSVDDDGADGGLWSGGAAIVAVADGGVAVESCGVVGDAVFGDGLL